MQRLRLPLASFASFLGLTVSLAISSGAALTLGACGGSGGTGGSGGGTTTGTAGTTTTGTGGAAPLCYDYTGYDGTTPTVSFQADVLPIFRLSCGLSTSCHGSQNGHPAAQHYLGPRLKDPDPTLAQLQAIFDQNLDVDAVANPDMKVIVAGHPEQSFLMYKLDGVKCDALTCATGAKNTCLALMPQGNTEPMDAAKRDVVRAWIKQGAKND